MKWCDIEMMKWIQNGKMAKCWYFDIVIWCDSILLGQICNTKSFIYFYKHLENIKGSDPAYIHYLKTQLESTTEELLQLHIANKENIRPWIESIVWLNSSFLEMDSRNRTLQVLTTKKVKKHMYKSRVKTTIHIMNMLNMVFQAANPLNNRWSQRR